METHARHTGTSGFVTIAGVALLVAATWALLSRPEEFLDTLRIIARAILVGPRWLGIDVLLGGG